MGMLMPRWQATQNIINRSASLLARTSSPTSVFTTTSTLVKLASVQHAPCARPHRSATPESKHSNHAAPRLTSNSVLWLQYMATNRSWYSAERAKLPRVDLTVTMPYESEYRTRYSCWPAQADQDWHSATKAEHLSWLRGGLVKSTGKRRTIILHAANRATII